MPRKVDLRRSTTRTGEVDEAGEELRLLIAELVERRRKVGMSQAQLAERIGTSQRTISQLENLAHEPKLGTLVVWARAVGLQLAWSHDQ